MTGVEVIVATTNPGKLAELRSLVPAHWRLLSLADIGLEAPEEMGQTFLDNALQKAQYAAMTGRPAIADDSGLEVDGLCGAPGLRSARFAGARASDARNNRELIRQLSADPGLSRTARFMCAVVLAAPGGDVAIATGEVHGVIVDSPRGECGFGYDPHFEIRDDEAQALNGRTMAELSLNEKNRLSHRARAYERLIADIRVRRQDDALRLMLTPTAPSGDTTP
jgi:XTP/dITP diphosphohydrolase